MKNRKFLIIGALILMNVNVFWASATYIRAMTNADIVGSYYYWPMIAFQLLTGFITGIILCSYAPEMFRLKRLSDVK